MSFMPSVVYAEGIWKGFLSQIEQGNCKIIFTNTRKHYDYLQVIEEQISDTIAGKQLS